MTTANKTPDQIRAHVHEDAIQRVTRFYNASTSQCLQEILQNSRRAGATSVAITMENHILAIQDDGSGVQDPQALLGFGHSSWEGETTRREDPAGMGIYSLSRCNNVSITSHCAETGAAWQVDLDEEHFVGAKPANVRRLDPAQTPLGTKVTFPAGPDALRSVEAAARYYPLPVTLNGVPLEQEDFLANMEYVEEWEGLRIGVKNARYQRHDSVVNFHGLTTWGSSISDTVSSKGKHWCARIDVVDCPRLELTLPARQEVVNSPFNKEVKMACRRAIYRAMLASGEHVQVSRRVFDDAAEMGIQLPEAKPLLHTWVADTADTSQMAGGRHHDAMPVDVSPPEACIIMSAPINTAMSQTLDRAIKLAQPEWQLLEPDPDYNGYAWYDSLSHVREMTVTATTPAGDTVAIKEDSQEANPLQERPESITIRLQVDDQRPAGQRRLELPTDLAFWAEEYAMLDEAEAVLTTNTDITVEELSRMLMDAFFHPSDDKDADSYQTQQDYAEREALSIARGYLQSPTEALRHILTSQALRHLRYEIPDGWTAVITIQPPNGITVDLTEASPEDKPPTKE